jgi:1-acyl-sn-glycerol-3-phosphate acyltransferase
MSFATLVYGFSMRWEGAHHIPTTGPALLVANHESYLDPLAVGVASSRRRLCFLARKTLFNNLFFGALLRSVNCVGVDQEGVAKEGLKTVLDRLALGEAVLIFPEGERSWDGQMQPLKPGVSLVVRRSPVPVVPIGVAGAFDAFPRTQTYPTFAPLFLPATRGTVAVSIGEPLPPQTFDGMGREELLRLLFDRIAACRERARALRRK